MPQQDKVLSTFYRWFLPALIIASLIAVLLTLRLYSHWINVLLIAEDNQDVAIICATLVAIALLATVLIIIWMFASLARKRYALEHTEKLEALRAEAMHASRPHHQLLIVESIKTLLQALQHKDARALDETSEESKQIARTFTLLNNLIEKNIPPAGSPSPGNTAQQS